MTCLFCCLSVSLSLSLSLNAHRVAKASFCWCFATEMNIFISTKSGCIFGINVEMLFGIFLTSYVFLLRGVFAVDTVEVSLMERDSVTLYTDVQTNQQEKITFFFNNTRIAEITGDQSKICTDVQCNNGTERFRDRLKLDHQTGSLTIKYMRITDEGVYQLQVIGSNSSSEKIFNFSVYERHYLNSVEEGDSVTFHPGEIKHRYDVKWYFYEFLIAEITGNQSKICKNDLFDKSFTDRLKLDHQTGSLTIMDVTTNDPRMYELQIKSSSFSIYRRYNIPFPFICVYPIPREDPVMAIGLSIGILLVTGAAAVGVCCYRLWRGTSPANKYQDDV